MIGFTTYIENKAPEGSPANLEVRIQTFVEGGIGPKGETFITPGLNCAEEVDYHIDRAIASLDRVRIEAKAKLEENEWS